MTQIVSTQTHLDQAVELFNKLSLDEIKQLFQRVPTLRHRFVEEKKIIENEWRQKAMESLNQLFMLGEQLEQFKVGEKSAQEHLAEMREEESQCLL